VSKKDPYSLREIFEVMTLNLIASLKRNLSRHEIEESKVGFRFDQWQFAKLKNLRLFRKKNKEIVTEAGKEADKLIDEVLQQSFKQGENNVEIVAEKTVKLTGEIDFPKDFKPKPTKAPTAHNELPKAPPESEFFGINEKKIKALQDSVKSDLKDGREAVLRKMDDVYRQTIFKAEAHMTAGAMTLNQAVDMATKDFLARGLDVIVYSNGRRVPITAYAEMALRTASQRATFLGEGKKRDEWGVYTVVMSVHANCSPWCLPYQGTVMIDDVYTSISKEQAQQLSNETGYILLSEAMAEGAFHPACRHTLATFFPGISQLPVKPEPEKALETYLAEQKQRYHERRIREYKRLQAGSLDDATQAKYSLSLTKQQDKLKALLADHPQLRRDKRRERHL
jgi:hypothetical protein